MKHIKSRFSIFIFSFLIFSVTAYAQPVNILSMPNLAEVNMDEIADVDIKNYYKKAMQNGLTEENLYRLLEEKGLPPNQLAKLVERVGRLGLSPSIRNADPLSETKSEEELKKDEENRKKEKDKDTRNKDENDEGGEETNASEDNVPMEKVKADLTIFGSELFTAKSKVFEPNLRIATPAGYILGPDDEIIVNVFGLSEKTYALTLNAEGNVYIPQVGPLYLNGLSIEQASGRIRSKLASTIYRAIGSGQTRVQVSLGKIRTIRVTVIGESKKPGTYTVSSLTTLFNLLYLCGGPSDKGSYRGIEIIRGNDVKRTADLYSFLLKGNQSDNILLQEGDLVRIPYYKSRVTIKGHVKHPGKFEMVPGETFSNLLDYCGGFTDYAYKAGVSIYQLTETEQRILDLPSGEYSRYEMKPSDKVVVGRIQSTFENKLVITGSVLRPGEYELATTTTLRQLIEKAGGLREDAYGKRGSISRLNKNKTPVHVSFSLDSIMAGLTDVPLRKNDSVSVYSIFDLSNEKSVNIDGSIKKPGKYKWAESITLNDLILAAGGLTDAGDINNIEIARRVENPDITKLNHIQTEIIQISPATDEKVRDILLKPYDVINIRQQPGYRSKRTVIVEGMVKIPGRYTLMMNNDRISDLIERAGGFRANADTSAVVIKRLSRKIQSTEDRQKIFQKLLNIRFDTLTQSENLKNEIYRDYDKISINLKEALLKKDAPENMELEDGDVITVERNTSLVKVTGEVYFPTIIPYKKKASLKYYIQKSGSFTQLARRNGTLVIYPDGKAKKVKHFLFFRNYPTVASRSEIFVPQKTAINRTRVTVTEWAVLLSSLGIIANVIVNLTK